MTPALRAVVTAWLTFARAALAKARAFRRNGAKYPGLCLQHVRTTLGIPARYGSAIKAWRGCPAKHRHTGQAPMGYPEFYDIGQFGHVTLSCGNGLTFSNVTRIGGLIRRVRRSSFSGYVGWTTQLNGVDLPPPPRAVFAKRSHGWAKPGKGRQPGVVAKGSQRVVCRTKTRRGATWLLLQDGYWYKARRTDWRT